MTVTAQKYITGSGAGAIAASVEAAIRGGRLPPGERLPTVRAAAAALEVSPATVAAAYRRLRERGLVATAGRRGTRVSGRPPVSTRAPAPVPARVRNLAEGSPDPELLPPLGPSLRALDARHHLYGTEVNLPALVRMAGRRLEADGIPSGPLTIVGGALDGVERVLEARLRPGDRVVVEDPGFPGVLDLVNALGLEPVPCALDDAGPLPDALERALGRGSAGLVVTPRAQNPTGAALDAGRVRALRRVLRAYPDLLVIEDDHAGPVAGAPARTLCDARRDRWAVVRSVSKWLGPDLRLALLTGDATTVARVEGRQIVGIRWVSHLLQRLVVSLWSRRGTSSLLRRAERTYTERRRSLLRALAARGIPARGCSGLNVWIEVGEEARVSSLLLDAGWAVAGGERFRIDAPPAVRVTTATLRPDEAERFASDLARILRPPARTSLA